MFNLIKEANVKFSIYPYIYWMISVEFFMVYNYIYGG